jgi:hypothetical protein
MRGRPPQQCRITSGVSRGKEKQPQGLFGKLAQLCEQAPRRAARHHLREPESPGQQRWRYILQQAKQRTGNPPCFGEYLIPDPVINRIRHDGGQQVAGVGIAQSAQRHRGQAV